MPNNSVPRFHDPVFCQWFFFRRQASRGGADYAARFEQLVQQKVPEWAPPLDGTTRLSQTKSSRRSSRIAGDEWKLCALLDGSERLCDFEARSLLDVFWLQLGQATEGDFTATELPPLSDATHRFPAPESDGDFLLGEAVCLIAEFDETALSLASWRARAEALSKQWLPAAPAAKVVLDCRLEYGYFAHIEGAPQITLVLLVYSSHVEHIAQLRGVLLPKVALILSKFHQTERDYDEILAPAANKVAAQLDEHLKTATAERSLDELEQYTAELARAQLALLPAIESIASRIQTLRVNAQSLERIKGDSNWGAQFPPALPEQEELNQFIAQMESDLHYLSLSQHKADVVAQQLQTLASVRVAQSERSVAASERNLAGVLAVLAVLTLVQTFPDWPFWEAANSSVNLVWKIFLIVGGVCFLLAAWHGWFAKVSKLLMWKVK